MNFAWTEFKYALEIIALITGISHYAIKKETKEWLAQQIKNLSTVKFTDMIRGLNGLFIKWFDKLYEGKHFPQINRFLWQFVFLGTCYVFSLFMIKFFRFYESPIFFILGIGFLGTFTFLIGIELGKHLGITMCQRTSSKIGVILYISGFVSMFGFFAKGGGKEVAGVGGILIALGVGVLLRGGGIIRGGVLGLIIGVLMAGGIIGRELGGELGGVLSMAVLFWIYFKVLLPHLRTMFIIDDIFNLDVIVFRKLTQISSIRVIITSIISIVLLSIVFHDVANDYLQLINRGEWVLLLYLMLNILADSFSVHETRWVLCKAKNSSLKWLGVWLLGDIIFSGLLFIVIPTVTIFSPSVFQAILFKGDQAYLGIFFWSTFSTSIMFYLFLIVTSVMTIFYKPIKWTLGMLLRLDIEKNPIFSLGLVAMMLTLIGFLLGGIFSTGQPTSI